MSRPIIIGEIPGIEEGQSFDGRKEMMPTCFHRNWAQGIDGNGREGSSAIVLSGGYVDNIDLGDEILYTGEGGFDRNTRKQFRDQTWKDPGNAGLLVSMNKGFPIRVIRGYTHKSEFSPKRGYTYAGLYSVVDAWEEIGKSGYKICRFRLLYSGKNAKRKTPEEVESDVNIHEQIELDYRNREKKRKEGTVLRIIRDTKISSNIKQVYKYQCQVCGVSIKTKFGNYAEGAHIKPLGKPHNGNDNSDNLLCLCPNHHVMFDKGAFSIKNNLELIGRETGKLIINRKHKIDEDNLEYHRRTHGYD